ncbi:MULTISPECIES: efflux RND transporter permease subunit [unclassified Arthrobacter]|jgi:CzcA family heavy metal efflux pump|uniref:efflux RND transporter permease subunit n=2 Tax=Arthrobacter TaxID=1663 RepID=UPI0004777C5C|nr:MULTISPECIES: efflux RND transporter permease subunit [unclassified Arthrobacter]TWD56403.1 CzcA family heavy metal efflux pump [Arthrobacter sp. AG367]BCW54708.1 cation efflux system protein [Arthrobacter sp. StoSoilB19]BCW75754.1 cation efflux system protein [Arthrobacter sp. NicSoilB11]
MRWIIGVSLRFRTIVVAIACAVMLLGSLQLGAASVDVFPEFAPPRVEIQTACLGLTAQEVEELVSVPIEAAVGGMPGLDELRSKSVAQLSSIVLLFHPGTDLLNARQQVSERMASVTAALPTWAAPPVMLQPLSATSRVMKIGMTSSEHSLIEMSMLSYWTIRARLLRVPGVANVAIWGERLQMLQVQVEPDKLKAQDVSLNQVMEVTAGALDAGLLRYSPGRFIGTGGFIDSPNQRMGVRHVQPIKTPADLAQVTIREKDGVPLHLGDVAQVVEDHQPLIGDAVINSGHGLMLIVEKLPWGNTLDVTKGVEEALHELQPGLSGISFDTTIFRPASFVEESISNLSLALLLGCLLVVLILGAFLFQWRTALISLIAIPLSLLTAALVLYFTASSINTMVLAGLVIAVGVVVDDAIIDVENIMRRLRQHRARGSGESTSSVVLKASLEMRSPIVYATLIIVVAAVPIFFLDGLTGVFFRPLAITYTLAVLASMLVALTVTPALALILLGNAKLEERDAPLVRVLKRGYHAVLSGMMKRPRYGYAGFGVVALAGLAIAPLLGSSLFPTFKERDFLMHWVSQPGTSAAEEYRISQRGCEEFLKVPGVLNCGTHIGQAFTADEIVGVNAGEHWISIDRHANYDETLAAVQDVVNGYPGLHRDVQTYLKERIEEVLTGASEPILVRVYGDDLNVLREQAQRVKDILDGIHGTQDAHVSLEVEVPQISVTVNLAQAQKYGLKPGDVRRAAATLVAGEEVGDVFRDGRAYDVHVWSTPATRSSVTSIEDLPIDTPTGQRVRLADLATVALQPVPNQIDRTNGSRRVEVGSFLASGADLGNVARELQQRLDTLDLPAGYSVQLLGEYTEREAATNRLMIFAAAALVLILLLLQTSFRSWRLAVLSLLTLPIALVGGVFAAFMSGGILSLGSVVGFLTVMGIAARNGILLISHCQHLERDEGETFGRDLVLRGAAERLSPILMTTLATGLALVPLVVMGNVPGHEIEHPMAVVILGGLVTSTLLNLFIVPSLYLRFAKRRPARGTRRPNPEPAPAG